MSTYPKIAVNGIDMSDSAGRWALDESQAARSVPGRRNTTVTVPGRRGVLWPRNDVRDTFQFPVTLKVVGYGSTPDAKILDFETNLNAILFLLTDTNTNAGTIIDYYASDSSIYRAEGRISVAPVVDRISLDAARVSFIYEIPDGCWHATGEVVWNRTNAVGTMIEVDVFNGSTAPITDAKMWVRGPFTSFSIRDETSQQQLVINRTLASTRVLVMDFNSQEARVVNYDVPNLYTAHDVDVTSDVVPSGPGSSYSWMNLCPQVWAGDPLDRRCFVRLNCGGGSGANPIQIRARKAY